MRRRTAFAIRGLAAAAVTLCIGWLATSRMDGPWGMIPGGAFAGPDTPCERARWERHAGAREVELEVRPEAPRSVTTWSVVEGGELFVPADFLTPWKRWPHQVRADPRVRLRVGGRGGEVFACRAERVDDAARVARLRAAIAAKYDLAPDGRAARAEVWWFRIGPRAGRAGPR